MLKKRFIMLIAVIMLLLVALESFAATSQANVVIRHLHYRWREAEKVALDNQIKEFEAANPGITIEPVFVPYADIRMTLLRDRASGTVADVFEFEATMISEFKSLDMLRDITDVVDKDIFIRGAFDGATFDERIYATPHAVWLEPAMYYRKDIFREAGIQPATWDKPWTMDQALDAAKKLTVDRDSDGRTDRWGWVERGKLGVIFVKHLWWYPRVAGVDLIKQDQSGKWVSSVSDPQVSEALRFYVDLVLKHKVAPSDMLGYGWDEWGGGFVRGDIAMGSMGTWAGKQLYDANPNLDWDIMPLPYKDQPSIALYHHLAAISKTTKHAKEAALWLKWMTERKDNSIEQADAEGSISPLVEVAEDPDYTAPPQRVRYTPILPALNSEMYRIVTPPMNPNFMGIMENIVAPSIHEVILGKTSFDNAIDRIDREIQRRLR